MERFLRSHASFRWFIIFFLLMGIGVEGALLWNAPLFNGAVATGGGGDIPPTATPAQSGLTCRVVNAGGVNLRRQPTVEGDNVVTTLTFNTPLDATARNGEVPWLRVRAGEQESWVSSKLSGGQALVECDGDLMSLPEQGPETSAADNAEERSTPTPAPTVTAEPTLTPAPDVRLRVGNGPDLHAARRTFEVSLDGVLTEWGNTGAAPIANVVFRPENWRGPDDLGGVARAAWDEQFLYLAAQVSDDQVVQESREDLLVRGDAIEFFWDAELERDFDSDSYNSDETQMVLSPGNFAGADPSAWVYLAPGGNFRSQIAIAASRSDIGYDIEMRIPWSGLGVTPAVGNVYGYAVALSDDDVAGDGGNQESQLATSSRLPYPHPTHWGNFILD